MVFVLDKSLITINSRDVQIDENSEFIVDMTNNIFKPPPRVYPNPPDSVYVRVYIHSAVITNNFDRITDRNNKVILSRPGAPDQLITFQIGCPSVYDIQDELSQQSVSVEYDESINKFVFRTNEPYTLDFTLGDSAHTLLGFDRDIYTITNGFIPPKDADVGSPAALFINCDLTPNSSYRTTKAGVVVGDQTLACIPIIVQPFQNIVYTDPAGIAAPYDFLNQGTNAIRFWLTDQRDDVVQLKGDWMFVLAVEHMIRPTVNTDEYLDNMTKSISQIADDIRLFMAASDAMRDLEKHEGRA